MNDGALGVSVAALVVLALASYRLTRIVTTDTITERARDRVYRWAWVERDEPELYAVRRTEFGGDAAFGHSGDANPPMPRAGGARTYVNELVNCPWCMGVWISAGLYAVWRWWSWEPVQVVIVMLAIAGAQGWLQSREG